MAGAPPAAGYKFNTFQEIKSHSSILFNERLAILFYLLDMKGITMNTYQRVDEMLEVRGIIKQIYKNVRTLIRNNPTMRATLNLDTKDKGIYITDLATSIIDKMIEHCEVQGYTTKKVYIIISELNKFEMLIKDILQYYHYFIRPDFRQKPDIEVATEKYKEIADKRTLEELREIVGKRNTIDFEGLGSSRIELKHEVEYDKSVDGEVVEDSDEIEEVDDANYDDSEYNEIVDGEKEEGEIIYDKISSNGYSPV